MNDRIQKILSAEQLTSARFADLIGVQRSSVSHVLSGRNKPSSDFLVKILQYFPSINAEWLLLGKGDMYKNEHMANLFDPPAEQKPQITPPVQNKNKVESLPQIQEVEDIKISVQPQHTIMQKSIERIVIFYNDKTFSEYTTQE